MEETVVNNAKRIFAEIIPEQKEIEGKMKNFKENCLNSYKNIQIHGPQPFTNFLQRKQSESPSESE